MKIAKKKTRGLKWTDSEIKEMLKVAVQLNKNKLFDSHKFCSNEIFQQIAAEFPAKDVGQIKLKYDALRRNFTADKAKNGFAIKSETLYDKEMAQLWGNRKYHTVPQDHGIDVTLIQMNPYKIEPHSDDESSNSTKMPELPRTPTAGPSTLTQPPRKKRKISSLTDTILEEFRAEQQKIMTEFERMHREAEDRSDKRCRLFLEELKAIRETKPAASPQGYVNSQTPTYIHIPNESFSSRRLYRKYNLRNALTGSMYR